MDFIQKKQRVLSQESGMNTAHSRRHAIAAKQQARPHLVYRRDSDYGLVGAPSPSIVSRHAAAQYRKALAQHNAQQQRAAANGAAAQNAPQVQKLPAGPL